ncbi:MAG: DNA polymerase III subunit gamma/tau [Candidatus Enteromonas sp.]|nr:DNA polymerase III subunit gamma/tau [Mollicutes bacterium]MDY3904346.1 DNA polymerase III subunit gamma/tau [Candidatus Enteromonas sp.]
MSYKALYNKYRPASFEEVAGQQSIVRTLRNAINSGKIAHAYLFCGPRGTGKTSMARLFAKALNCEEGIGHQCNKCSNCLALNSSSHPDVIEIDAASNNGVDQVRELIDQVRYLPIKGRYKVYIIDEVHMMSQGAFNALLKTLEEPPDHVIFILATTEPHKVLPTILSRCQRYDFTKIDDADLKAKLLWIAGMEDFSYEDAAIDEIVRLADGGMRDALSILDQALAYGDGSVNEKDILSVFGLTSSKQRVELLKDVINGNISSILSKEDEFVTGGIDVKRLCSSLLDILKDLLIYKSTKDIKLIRSLTLEEANDLSSLLNNKRINEMIDVLLKTQLDFKSVSNVRSLFELALLKMATANNVEEVSQVAAPKPVIKEEVKVETAPIQKVEVKVEPIKEEPKPVQKEEYNPDTDGKYTGSIVPSFLLEDEDEKEDSQPKEETPVVKEEAPTDEEKEEEIIEEPRLNTSKIKHTKVVNAGDKYELGMPEIIQIMVLATKFKDERKALYSSWNQLDYLKLDPKLGEAAALLRDGTPLCLCKDAIIIVYNFTRLANKANIKENQDTLEELLETLLGRKVFIFAIDRDLNNKARNEFVNLQQVNKLPNLKDINLVLPKEIN